MAKKSSSITGIDLKIQTKANLVPLFAKVIKETLIKTTFLNHTYMEQIIPGRGPIRVHRNTSIVDENMKKMLACKGEVFSEGLVDSQI